MNEGRERDSLVVVPTYNEAHNLTELVEEILRLGGFHVLVVDDSSPDGTGERAKRLAVRYPGMVGVLQRPAKLGIGSAYVDGFRSALGGSYSYIFQMDADFSHHPPDLLRLRAALETGADVAIGSRYVAAGGTEGWPLSRRLLSQGGSSYARLVLGLGVRDCTSGFKGFRQQVLQSLKLDDLQASGFAFQIEVTYRCAQQGWKIEEVPILFTERRVGTSKLSSGIVWEAIWVPWRLRLELGSGPDEVFSVPRRQVRR